MQKPASLGRNTGDHRPVWVHRQEIFLNRHENHDGTLDLVLNGPWEADKNGKVFRREVLWDDITARAWSLQFGRPVHLGEFGCHNTGDPASRARYLHDVRTLAEERHIPWTLWEWKSGFGYWDPQTHKPRLRVSLFE